MNSKTIILSQPDANGRGILTLWKEDGLLKGKLRLYNLKELDANCKLGIYHNDEVFASNLILKQGVYYTSLVGDFKLENDFYTAIINPTQNNNVVLAGGTYGGFYFSDNSVFNEADNSNSNNSLKVEELNPIKRNPESVNCDSSLSKTENEQKPSMPKDLETDQTNKSEFCKTRPNCANCKYKEFFYNYNPLENNKEQNQTNQTENVLEENETDIKQVAEKLLPQFNYIIKNYPANEQLNNLIEGGKFVNIESDSEKYSLGAIWKDDKMKYICYAVFCNYNSPVPQELGKHYQWLPVDELDPLSAGYYIVYQDAEDLKIIEF